MNQVGKQRIVVMGGSFNPPTIAHLRVMEAAMRAVGAEKGIFIPVGEAYLKRKLRRAGDRIRLSESMRLEMLRAMCADREELLVSDVEIQNPSLITKDTMHILQGHYPGAALFFIAGADKLALLASFAARSDFFDHFHVVLFSREGVDAQAAIQQDERFAPCASAFVHARQPDGVDGVSSTAVRRLIENGDTEQAYPYLHPDVWQMLRGLTGNDFPFEIERFEGEYDFLSNRYPAPVRFDGLTFPCAESAFQAAKCLQPADRERIARADAGKAKVMAAKCPHRPDWEDGQLAVMEAVLRAKFTQHPELARKLADTGRALLISSGKDHYWSRDLYTNRGENRLGQLLMKLRADIQSEKEGNKQ